MLREPSYTEDKNSEYSGYSESYSTCKLYFKILFDNIFILFLFYLIFIFMFFFFFL